MSTRAESLHTYLRDARWFGGKGREFKVTDDMSIRGDILAIGDDDDTDMFDGARATVGVLWHF